MYRFLEYLFLFVLLILFQVFLFNNLNLSLYVNPLVYVAFLIMLPMEINRALLLGLGCVLGVVMDLMSGTAGLHTIASLATAFVRPGILLLLVGRDELKEGGVPTFSRLERKRYLRYLFGVVGLHCTIYFLFESLTWDYFHVTFLRIVCSTLATAFLVYCTQLLFVIRGSVRNSERSR